MRGHICRTASDRGTGKPLQQALTNVSVGQCSSTKASYAGTDQRIARLRISHQSLDEQHERIALSGSSPS